MRVAASVSVAALAVSPSAAVVAEENGRHHRELSFSKSSKSGTSNEGWYGPWNNGPHPPQNPWDGFGGWHYIEDDSSSSSDKSGKGSKSNSSTKSSKSTSESDKPSESSSGDFYHDAGWFGGNGNSHGPWGGSGGWYYVKEDSSWGSSTKSGKGSKSNSSKSSKSNGKSGKSHESSSGGIEDEDEWYGAHDQVHSPWGESGGWWYGEDSSTTSSGKSSKSSGKSSKSSGKSSNSSGKSGKSSRGDGGWNDGGWWHGGYYPRPKPTPKPKPIPKPEPTYVPTSEPTIEPESVKPPAPDSSSPGICAPDFSNGGLNCAHDLYYSYCTEPGFKSECGSGETCYSKDLCPVFNDDGHGVIGVCSHGNGIECSKVNTYCTEPGGHGECGEYRECFDAKLCGLGDGHDGDFDGVCGLTLHQGGGLECSQVTTHCSRPGKHAECADGAFCFPKDFCDLDQDHRHAGVCATKDGFSCEEAIDTYCAEPGKDGQCGFGKKCYDAGLCYTEGDFPGVCAPKSGLNCVDVTMFCTEPGSQAECGYGNSCYDVNLCTGEYVSGVCAPKEDGLLCEEVTTFCSVPGSGSAECSAEYECLDAELCGGKSPSGVCASVDDGLECSLVTTYCSKPGYQSECGDGLTCMDSALCGYKPEIPIGVCTPNDSDLNCGEVTTFCSDPSKQAECSSGNMCVSGDKCGYDDGNIDGEDVCFEKSVRVECAYNETGGVVFVPFTYHVETKSSSADEVIEPIEYEILYAVSDYVADREEYTSITRISAAPSDMIKDDEVCYPEDSSNSCTVVKGEMSIYQVTDDMDSCDYNEVVKNSIIQSDLSGLDGVESVRYTGSEGSCDGKNAIIANPVESQEEGLGAGAMFGIAAVAAALAALALLAAKRRMKRRPEGSFEAVGSNLPKDDDFSLVSADTNIEGTFLGAVGNDPFASTVDVHKCTSMYCTCNKGLSETTFIPVHQENGSKKHLKTLVSPQGVDEAQAFFPDDSQQKQPQDDGTDDTQNNIMRIPHSYQIEPEPYRSLTPVNEIPHDSEIDTEFESEGEDDFIPPPPPPLPPNYGDRNAALDSDEMSI
mmetsp:Transcript_24990/g.50268  ORF Transcript_24990/g.50268 Transcript_24990/m.50268 type:complete len:1067 (+) Transcript_24990:645-3845(+)